MKETNVLYISIIGLSEPLGKSQVLEYLKDLSKEHNIDLHTFEKDLSEEAIEEIKTLIHDYNISWTYQTYDNKYGIFSTFFQIINSVRILKNIIKTKNIKLIHARSLIPAFIGLFVKNKKVKLLFDIRAFQIDEKTETGRIKEGSLLYKILKFIENYTYKKSDHIVTLTKASAKELEDELNISSNKFTVIPTCANTNVFKKMDLKDSLEFKRSLGFKENDKIVTHIGDVRERYDFEYELKLFKNAFRKDSNLKLLIVNRGSEHDYIKNKLILADIPEDNYKLYSSYFYDVYKYLSISDVSLFLIRPSYSRIAMSPTKFAENLACEVPSFTNTNVGDMKFFMENYNAGYAVDMNLKNDNLDQWTDELINLIYQEKTYDYKLLLDKYFTKDIAVKNYSEIYKKLDNE